VDIFRTPKLAYHAAAETNQPVYLALRSDRRNIYGPDEVELKATVASELEEPFDARLEGEVIGPDGRVVHVFEHAVRISQGVVSVMSEPLPTDGLNGLCSLRARLWQGGERVTENEYAFRVIPRKRIPVPHAEIAVCDPSGALSAALAARDIPFAQFGADTTKTTLVVANARALHVRDSHNVGRVLVAFARSGGTVLYLDIPPGKPIGSWAGNQRLIADWLPLQLCLRPTRGLWTPFAHVIREHAVSRWLPAGKIMDRDYVNVYPHVSIVNVSERDPTVPLVGMDLWSWLGQDATRAPVGTLGLGWRPGAFTDDRDYRGPGPVIYGVDLIDWPCGEGRVVLSTLRLIDSLGRDPVADMLLINIVSWAAELNAPRVNPAADEQGGPM
jgi:hypothetical protein